MATPAPLPLLERPQVAALLSVKSPITISKWELEGLPVAKAGKPGLATQYDPAAVVAWYVAREVAKWRGTGEGALDPAAERARKDGAQADLSQQMLAVRGGALVPVAETLSAWVRLVTAAKAKLLAIPRSVAFLVAQLVTPSEIEALLRDKITEALSELSRGEDGETGGPVPTRSSRQPR